VSALAIEAEKVVPCSERNSVVMTIKETVKSLSGIRLAGGMFKSLCTVIMVTVVSLASLAALSRDKWVIAGAIVLLIFASWSLLWQMIRFAQRHPHAAILDGALYLERERLFYASKGNPELPMDVSVVADQQPQTALPAIDDEAGESDESDTH
jgi:hypothetical protein